MGESERSFKHAICYFEEDLIGPARPITSRTNIRTRHHAIKALVTTYRDLCRVLTKSSKTNEVERVLRDGHAFLGRFDTAFSSARFLKLEVSSDLANLLIDSGRIEEGRQILENLLEGMELTDEYFANLPDLRSELNSSFAVLGTRLEKLGLIAEAEKAFRKGFENSIYLTTKNPEKDYYWYQFIDSAARLIRLLSSTGSEDEGKQILALMTLPESSSAEVYARRAKMYVQFNELDKARADCNKIIEAAGDQVTGHHYGLRADIYRYQLKDLEAALADYNKAVEIDPQNENSYPKRASLLVELNRKQEAMADYHKFAAIAAGDDSSYYPRYQAALLALALGEHEQYQADCEAMLDTFKDTEQTIASHYFAVWTCVLGPDAVDDYAMALQLAQKTGDAAPEDQFSITVLGAAQFRDGQFDKAMESFSAASGGEESEKTSNAYIAYFRSMTEYQLNRPEAARESLAQANKMADAELNDADNPPAWNRKLTLQLLRKEAEGLMTPADDAVTDTNQPALTEQ
jgi:tetratricopeptide (TPR) repeat protein